MFLRIILAATLLSLLGCSDFIHPVKSTPEPTEYSFNYWLLQKVYLYEDELTDLSPNGDSDSIKTQLYDLLKDPFTTYVPPTKSEERATAINTSLVVGGDVGMRYFYNENLDYPIIITRVYPKSPAGRAGVPRYGRIISANGIDLSGEAKKVKAVYDSVLSYSKNIDLVVAQNNDTNLYKLEKETVYAPTVFVDTVDSKTAKNSSGIIFITIEGFKPTTANQDSGTYGELKAYLDSTGSDKRIRVLDLRGNPGGHVNQCLAAADLFVKQGTLSTRRQRSLDADGETKYTVSSIKAKAGDPGESGKYIIYANGGSASCAEIFIAAVTETTDIPFVGKKTYGKGIGQTNYFTYAGGLATITNFEFLTPKGNSYHKKGIYPKYECDNVADQDCAIQYANKIYGSKSSKQENALTKPSYEFVYYNKDNAISEFEGGSIIWENSSHYLDAFKKSQH
ncbi:S41 family peptidase [Fibrobacter sp. UWB13]|uniref:S41 family peptidase n=1 Tax=Fibrobacter sp. UWB13 TaxID=1896204 RepID=UPI000A0A52F3|nr:S41 family peptidase [Fibrobacter sp. UWB13]SMG23684.1 C-terminal peptidase (prc) [Fibrobacter sp. UWB13]